MCVPFVATDHQVLQNIVTISQPLTKLDQVYPSYTYHHTHTLVPFAPTILAVEATSSTSLSVKWAACTNDGGSPITGYVVEYRPALDPASPIETCVVEREVLSTTLDDLTPSTLYEVRVRGENAVGRSDPSSSRWTKTKPDGELSEEVVQATSVQMELLTMFLNLLHIVNQ